VTLVLLALVAIYSLAAPLATGQGRNPRASTEEGGQTSGVATSIRQHDLIPKQNVTVGHQLLFRVTDTTQTKNNPTKEN